jgi:L-histidine N-alpha-methyltransferase
MATNRDSTIRPAALGSAESTAQFIADLQFYLEQSPRQLPSRYFYDELGSALFEAICRLPWYGITRAESRLLTAHGGEIFRQVGSPNTIVELGSGSGDKLRLLIEAAESNRAALNVHLVDVSHAALETSQRALDALANVTVVGHQLPYEQGLAEATRRTSRRDRTLALFLGSNIGNFDPPGAAAFLHNIRINLAAGDALLLGADLIKGERELLLAYDDPLGVTAAFNRNLLVRINRELGGNFDLQAFAHRAVWNAEQSRVEMHLVARSAQEIHIERAHLDFRMESDEPIWTESSYKYRTDDLFDLLESSGFRVTAQWIDPRAPFALTLAAAA